MSHAGTVSKLCVIPRPFGVGGMVSFHHKFIKGLTARGIDVTHDLEDTPFDAVLVIGGTRQLVGLRRIRRRGIPIVQRLQGINWLHRKLRTGLRHYLRAEWGNWVLATIRGRMASSIVYQSEFVRGWWERDYGPTPVTSTVVHNGVDLERYNPDGSGLPPEDRYRLLLVEGTLGGGYEMGLEHALSLAEGVKEYLNRPIELMVVGRVSDSSRRNVERRAAITLVWAGLVPHERIPELDRSAHVLFSADINSACPNAVIEAMACGLPVVAFDTGALPELVTGDAGRLMPYGGDPWKLDSPDMDALVRAANEILTDQSRFRAGARARVEAGLGLAPMMEGYLAALERAR